MPSLPARRLSYNQESEAERMKVREAIRMVRRDGWYHVRTRGSHRHYKYPRKPGKVTIPGQLGKDLPIYLRESIKKQAGLK